MLRTVIDKNSGKELRAQFDDFISNNEILIDDLRIEQMENPYWDFEKKKFYDKQ